MITCVVFFCFLGEISQCGDKKNSLRSVPRIFWKNYAMFAIFWGKKVRSSHI
jgi:hypothetical protein